MSSAQDPRFSRRAMLGAAAGAIGAAALPKGAMAQAVSSDPAPAVPAGDGAVHITPRVIAPPRSISPQAQAYLARYANLPYQPVPPASDKAAWRAYVAAHDTMRLPPGAPSVLPGITIEDRVIGGTTVFVARRSDVPRTALKPHISIHGGGFTGGGGRMNRLITQVVALQYGGEVYSIDYRMPPDFPYPVPLEDCLNVYREMVRTHRPQDILVAGGSAGGNLAAAMLLKAKDQHLPMPAAVFLDTPGTDLVGEGDTAQTNRDIDVFLKRWIPEAIELYANGADRRQPYLSPLYGDLRGLPPIYIRSGTRDILLSDSVRFHAALRKAGIEADLYIREAMPHAGFGTMTPDDAEARADTVRWLRRHWMAEAGPGGVDLSRFTHHT